MSKEKLYFESIDDTFCRPLSYYLHDAKLEGKKMINLIEAEPDTETNNVIWCGHFGDCVERDECKKAQCEAYTSKSGRGVCSNRGKLYLHGAEIIVNVATGDARNK